LYRTDPDFFSFFEIYAYERTEDAPFGSEKDFGYEFEYHDADEDERDGVFGLKEDEKKRSEREEEHDACRDADFTFIDETVFIMLF
jgi:hypothetical protein